MNKKALLITVFSVLFFSLVAISFYAAYNSPFFGLEGAWDKEANAWKVTSAAPPFENGDEIEKIGDLQVGPYTLHKHISSLKNRRAVFEWYSEKKEAYKRLQASPAVFLIKRDGASIPVAVSARRTGLSFLSAGTIALLLTGILFFSIGAGAFYRKIEEQGLVFSLMCFAMAVASISYAMAVAPGPVLAPLFLFSLNVINGASYLMGFALMAHLSLLLPAGGGFSDRFRLLVPAFYSAVVALAASLEAAMINAAASALFIFFIASLAIGFIKAKNTLERQQMKWVFFGVCLGIMPNIALSILPLSITGKPIVPISFTGVFFVLIPLSMAFAIQKYRMLEIDSLLEGTFVYALVFAVMVIFDIVFLALTSENFGVAAMHSTGRMFLFTSLVILFYAALRDRLRRYFRRLFRKAAPDEAEVVSSFTDRAAGKPPEAIIRLFTETIKESFNPRRMVLIKRGEDGADGVFDSFGGRMEPAGFWQQPLAAPFQDIYVGLPLGKGETAEYAVLMGQLQNRFYSKQDMQVLRSLLKQARILYENAAYYEENIKQYRTILEKERSYRLEKEKILRDLHDGIGGITTNINLISKMARNSSEEEARKALRTISELSGDGLSDIRSFMQSMDVNETWHSLIAEFRNHGRTVMESHGKSFDINTSVEPGSGEPGTLLGLNLLRIYKEALTNIIKHSGGDAAAVSLSVTRERLFFSVSDNGTGFNGKNSGGRGIANMKARAKDLGGSLEILSGKGTTVSLEVPIPLKYPNGDMDLDV
ncbi:MAG: histidine kinase [Nitrospiraceae bacterium]|nr:histidine kinase [Nitrospiraceae bacterium]